MSATNVEPYNQDDFRQRECANDDVLLVNRDILQMIGSGAELNSVLHEIAIFVDRCIPHGRCMIALVDEDHSRFTCTIAPALPNEMQTLIKAMPIASGRGVLCTAARIKYPVRTADADNDSFLQAQVQGTPGRFVAASAWPVMGKRGQMLGVLSIFFLEQSEAGSADSHMVGICTDLAGIAIESSWADERIRRLAYYDELTGLPNRFLQSQYLEKAIARAQRHGTPVGMLLLDLDRFKTINDTFGHDAGDAILRGMSQRFKACLRHTDTIARAGGDEFIVLANDCGDPAELRAIAMKLLAEAARPFEINGQECCLSASIGMAAFPDDGEDARSILKNAEIAMYRVKAGGGNNFQSHSCEMSAHASERMALESELRRAIDHGEFVMHYQPKVDVQSGCVRGAEALVRWQHPERGLLSPAVFVPLAEETGLIGPLGIRVLELTCSDIAGFKRAGLRFGRIAVNLSASQFADVNLLVHIDSAMARHGIEPAHLEFEITESMVMNKHDETIITMERLRQRGFSLAIDDFGTGYSSLAYLKRFPVASVKIDKSFIKDIAHDSNDLAIVQAIMAMAHALKLEVVAEGVEDQVQLDMLRAFGCEQYQGYFFSKPIAAEVFAALTQP